MTDPADGGPAEAKPTGSGLAPAETGPDGAEAAGAEAAGAEAAEIETAEAEAAAAGEEPRRRKGWRRGLVELGVILVVAVVLAGLVRTFAFQTFWIPSASMVPTLQVYDRVIVQKAFYTWHDVREGDIVVFTHPPLDRCPGGDGDLVKRVIALPGQTIYSSGNTIYINGRPLAEPYLPQDDPLGLAIASRQDPYRVPPGEFYMMGDNRSDSCDSRYWGPIEGSTIVGKVVLTIWHNGHPEFHRF
jgi:signal peptidase I